jgi:ABC-type sugar transport system, permease component
MVKKSMKTNNKVKDSLGDRLFDIGNVLILAVATLIVLYPLYFIVIASFSDPVAVQSGEVLFKPKGFTLDGYMAIFKDKAIIRGYANSLFCVVFGTGINLFFTITCAYGLSKKTLPFRNGIMFFLMFTMFFGGGMIPTYLLVKNLGLLNSLWSLILTDALSIMNVIIVRTYFQTSIPNELYEAALIDGCSDIKAFIKIALPLAKPIIAIMALFYGVGQWNQLFKGIIYIQNQEVYPLQLVLRNILIQNSSTSGSAVDTASFIAQQRMAELIKYGVIIVGSLPPLLVYPLVQKHFKKGVMVGSVKG